MVQKRNIIKKIKGIDEASCFWEMEELKFEMMIRMVDILPDSPILDISKKPEADLKETCKRLGIIYKQQ